MAYVYATQDEAFDALEIANVPNGTRVVRNHDTDQWHFVDADGNVVSDPADAKAETVDEPARVAEPGDIVLQIGGAMLPAHAMLAAIQYARKLGLEVTLRDAFTMDVVKTVSKSSAKGARAARILTPTDQQQIVIDLCTRNVGASGAELLEAGAGGNAKPGKIAWRQLVDACTKFGYAMRISSRVELRKNIEQAVVVYHLDEVSIANDGTDAAESDAA